MTENPTGHDAIDSLSNETRTFAPPAAFAAAARISDGSLAAEAAADHEAFWARQARELLHWQQPFDTVLSVDIAAVEDDACRVGDRSTGAEAVSYTHLRAHET